MAKEQAIEIPKEIVSIKINDSSKNGLSIIITYIDGSKEEMTSGS